MGYPTLRGPRKPHGGSRGLRDASGSFRGVPWVIRGIWGSPRWFKLRISRSQRCVRGYRENSGKFQRISWGFREFQESHDRFGPRRFKRPFRRSQECSRRSQADIGRFHGRFRCPRGFEGVPDGFRGVSGGLMKNQEAFRSASGGCCRNALQGFWNSLFSNLDKYVWLCFLCLENWSYFNKKKIFF